MGKFIDETNHRYGRLTVIKKSNERSSSGSVLWICKCDCGNITRVPGDQLRNGKVQSCGCLHKERVCKNEIGNKYGSLTVIRQAPSREGRAYWVCQCDCGSIVEVSGTNLRCGFQQTCGCGQTQDKIGKRFGKLTVINRVQQNDWQCQCDCGNIIIVNGRELRRGHKLSCGCLKSVGEQTIINILTEADISFQTQKTFDTCRFPETNGLVRFDFYVNNNYLIEFDGAQHYQESNFFMYDLAANQKRDQYKNQWCKENNIPLIRIPYTHLPQLCLNDLLLKTSNFIIK